MSEEDKNGADVAVDAFGAKVNVKNVKSLNTIITVLGFVTTCMIAFVLWNHREDDREVRKEFVGAIKELTIAQRETTAVGREQNCLLSMPAEQRSAQKEFCKQISGASR